MKLIMRLLVAYPQMILLVPLAVIFIIGFGLEKVSDRQWEAYIARHNCKPSAERLEANPPKEGYDDRWRYWTCDNGKHFVR